MSKQIDSEKKKSIDFAEYDKRQKEICNEYEELISAYEGFYLKDWEEEPAYEDGILRCSEKKASIVKRGAEFAVSEYNKRVKNANCDDLQLTRVLRTNWQLGPDRYLITLEASDGKFYEAEVSLWGEGDEEEEPTGIVAEEDKVDWAKLISNKIECGPKDQTESSNSSEAEPKDHQTESSNSSEAEPKDQTESSNSSAAEPEPKDQTKSSNSSEAEPKDQTESSYSSESSEYDSDDYFKCGFKDWDDSWYFKLKMMRIARHYPEVDETYGPCT